MEYQSLGFIGGGRITRIVLNGLGKAARLPGKVVVSDTDEAVLANLRKAFPEITTAVADNTGPASCDMVFISLHPPAILDALLKIRSLIKPDAVVVSLAPKITLSRLTAILDRHAKIIRMIPNAPSMVNRGYNPVSFSRAIAGEEKADLLKLFQVLGECPEVPEENLEAYAIIAAMGPTYFWFQWHVLTELGRSFGLSETETRKAIPGMIDGAVHTMFNSNLPPHEVMDLVPVKPLAEDEGVIGDMYRTKLSALFSKLKG